MNRINQACKQYGLNLNANKTKYMIINKENDMQDNCIIVDKKTLDSVD